MRSLLVRCLGALGVVLILSGGCSDDSPTVVVPAAGTVNLDFLHHVAGQVPMQNVNYTNAAGDEYSIVRVNYLISNIELVATNGARTVAPGPFFIVVVVNVNADTLFTVPPSLTSVPSGTYDQLNFTFGLDESMNVTNKYLAEPWHGSMAWPTPLGGGYHYMIFDGFVTIPDAVPNAPTERTYNTHLGRTQTDPHYFKVELALDAFTVDGNVTNIPVEVDLSQWYEQPNVYAFPDPAFIMDKPDVQEVLRANGASVFRVSPVALPDVNR